MAPAVPKVLVLDAMGVIYRVGDDVADLLIPFIGQCNGLADIAQIEAAYIEASLGQIEATEFWNRIGVSPHLEDEYLERLELTDGLTTFLEGAHGRFNQIACLSNDVSAWSRKLRTRFELDRYITSWFISGDLGARKPSPEIYQRMTAALDVAPADILFVDDRPKNLNAAAELGIQTVYFGPDQLGKNCGHRSISRLSDLLD